eukprot:6212348-Pleurochrysis_carterae.AAC.4
MAWAWTYGAHRSQHFSWPMRGLLRTSGLSLVCSLHQLSDRSLLLALSQSMWSPVTLLSAAAAAPIACPLRPDSA